MMGSLMWQYKQESLNKQRNKDNKKVKTIVVCCQGFHRTSVLIVGINFIILLF